MIKIAYMINFIKKSGPSNIIKNLMRNIDLNKYEIFVITLFEKSNDKETVEAWERLGLKVICCKGLNRKNWYIEGQKIVEEIIKEHDVDIIHSHGAISDILANRVKHRCIKMSTLHCVVYEDYPLLYGKIKGTFLMLLHLHYLKKQKMVICCSESVYKAVSCLKNSTFVRNGLEEFSGLPHGEKSNDREKLIYIYVGGMNKRKNVVWLAEQFKKYHKPNEYLYILGTGEDFEECKKTESENIKVLGFKKNVSEYLDMADIYVSASKSEGFSVSVLEALEHGLGLFLSDIPSHKETFSIDENVYLGETFGETDFEEKLIRLRENRNKLIPEKIKEFKQKNLSARKMADEYMKIYEELLKEKSN